MSNNENKLLKQDSLDKRTEQLAIKLLSKDDQLNLDTLLDSMQSLYFEIKNSKLKAPGYDFFCKKFEKSVDIINNSRVNMEDFEQLKILGQGGFGTVVLVRNKYNRKVYAMKIMNKCLLLRSNQSAFFWEERQIMALSNSPWLVKLHFAFMSNNDIYMVMDFLQGGDLINLMSCYDIPLEWTQFYVAEAAIAINALHEFGFIHLDIKPDNMLLDHNGHLKLCDFGTCVNVSKNGHFKCNFAVGTPDYISPEMLSSHNHPVNITKATDWWSWAVFFYELLYDEPAFSSDSLVGTYARIANFESSLKFPDESGALRPACQLISRILVDVSERIGFSEIKSDAFFKSAPWNFDNIRTFIPPFIPEINGEDDVSNFEISDSADVSTNSSYNKASQSLGVCGDQLSFIGFSYNPSFQNITANMIDQDAKNSSTKLPTRTESLVNGEVARLKERIASCNKSLVDAENQNKALSNKNNELDVQLNNMKFQLEEEKRMNNDMKTKLQDYLDRKKIDDERIVDYINTINKNNMEIDRLHTICHDLENEKAQIEVKNSAHEFDSMTLRKNVDSIGKRMTELKIKYEKSLSEIDRLTAELDIEKQRNITTTKELSKSLDNTHSETSPCSDSLLLAELNTPAVRNRAAILSTFGSSNNSVSGKDTSTDVINLNAEIVKLREIIKQTTENECRLKTDLRIITNENNSLKEQINSSINNIQNSPEFLELQQKYNSFTSYVNLYKKQIKELNTRVQAFTKESSDLRTKLDQQINNYNELQDENEHLKKSYNEEVSNYKHLSFKVELMEKNHQHKILIMEKDNEQSITKLSIANHDLESAENTIIDLTEKLEKITSKYDNILNEKTKNENQMNENASVSSKWKNLFMLEKLKKDQAIKKLDELVQLVGSKGINKSQSTTTSTVDNKAVKKLQMELRNEKLKYEKLLAEKQSIVLEHSQKILKYETKIKKLKDKKHQLKVLLHPSNVKSKDNHLSTSFINTTKTTTTSGSTFSLDRQVPTHNTTILIDNKPEYVFDVTSHSNQNITNFSVSDNNIFNDNTTVNNNTNISSNLKQDSSDIILASINQNIHIEGVLGLIPYNKGKRITRKLLWKKHYAILTLNELTIYNDKSISDISKNIFKKMETRYIRKVSAVTHSDITKADSKDISRIFMIRYFDQDIANVAGIVSNLTTKNNNSSTNTIVSSDLNESTIKQFRGHKLLASKVDGNPFCGACSCKLGENEQGSNLLYCYECKTCSLKFHTSHINSNDTSVAVCSRGSLVNMDDELDPNNVDDNSNFCMEIFIMAPNANEQSKWIYAINRVLKISKSIYNPKHSVASTTSDNEKILGSPKKEKSKLRKKATVRYLESMLSRSKTTFSKESS